MPKSLDPARRPSKGLPAAPDGMETDPETGLIQSNDKTKGLKPLKKIKVRFPNMAVRRYATRPYFVHNWYPGVREALIRNAGVLQWDKSDQPVITAIFDHYPTARRFAKDLVENHHVPIGDIHASLVVMDKTSAHTPEALADRALQCWDSQPVQAWAQERGLCNVGVEPHFWLCAAITQDPSLHKSLVAALSQSAPRTVTAHTKLPHQARGPTSGLFFDPKRVVFSSSGTPFYQSTTPLDAPVIGDTVLVEIDGEQHEAMVSDCNDPYLTLAVFSDPMLNGDYHRAVVAKTISTPTYQLAQTN